MRIDQQFHDTTIDCTANEHETYQRCTFDSTSFTGVLNETVFHECSFTSATLCTCSDVVFKACTFHDVLFTGRLNDSHFSSCSLTAMGGDFRALRCTMTKCTFAACKFNRQSAWEQCKVHNSSFCDSTMEAFTLTDVEVVMTKFMNCMLRRCQVRRSRFLTCEFKQLILCSSTFAGNNWTKNTFSSCNDSFTQHLAERHTRTIFSRMSSVRSEFIQSTYARCVRNSHDLSQSKWDRCTHTDVKWSDVKLRCAHLNNVTYTNRSVQNVTITDAVFINMKRQSTPHLRGCVHYKKGHSEDETPINVHMFGHHEPIASTDQSSFRVSPATLCEIDFVHVMPTPGWFTFGFSTPQCAHHIVSHVTIGNTVFYPDLRPYKLTAGGTSVGYTKKTIRRAGSSPCLLRYTDRVVDVVVTVGEESDDDDSGEEDAVEQEEDSTDSSINNV